MSRKRYTIDILSMELYGRLIGNKIVVCRLAPVVHWCHSLVAGLFKCIPSNICAAFYQISTDSVLARSLSDKWLSLNTWKLKTESMQEI